MSAPQIEEDQDYSEIMKQLEDQKELNDTLTELNDALTGLHDELREDLDQQLKDIRKVTSSQSSANH